ncbi:MAG: LutB/LldF family L-lactate oxidation iron-sulfur protein [Pseudomonadota bacterium]
MKAQSSHPMREASRTALSDATLQQALNNLGRGFVEKRARAAADFDEFEASRDHARDIKNHTLAHLDIYLERYEARVLAAGGHVHWARNDGEARRIILDLCKAKKTQLVTKSKSMISEEIGLNEALETAGFNVLETDLGEYIIQLRGEQPSHIIAPAVHVLKHQVEETFRTHHTTLPADRKLDQRSELVREARIQLRQQFAKADIGITGANFLVADHGAAVIVTNEGNADLTMNCAKTHIVLASIEKMVPSLNDLSVLLRVLGRSATGQAMTAYTSLVCGPKRSDDEDGPEEFHVILLDHQRSQLLGGEFQDMLRCLRCGACLNHCPVYQAAGGHAYGSVYPGPMGSVLTPLISSPAPWRNLAHASTLCGRCEAVCPVRIPLPRMLRALRRIDFERKQAPPVHRAAITLWSHLARHPRFYGLVNRIAARLMKRIAGKRGAIQSMPGARGWCSVRDLPAPSGYSFQEWWDQQQRPRD